MIDTSNNTPAVELGQFRIQIVSGGRFKMDGGTMFGVVPKALWSRQTAPDQDNNLLQATNCLFVDTGQNKVLIDTGYGSKLSAKQRAILETQSGNPLTDSLHRIGVTAADIDTVIFSHLHFDHAGGATILDSSGRLEPTFKNAVHVVQRQEWTIATSNLPELRGAYPMENLIPLENSARLQLIDGPVEIAPGIHSIPTGGHSPGHQVIRLESQRESAYYLGDLCPTAHHLPIRWGTSYDLDVLELRRKKAELLGTIAERHSLVLFDHDPQMPYAWIQRDDDRDFTVIGERESNAT